MKSYNPHMQNWLDYISIQNMSLLDLADTNNIQEIMNSLINAIDDTRAIIMTAGNGGSATTADHFAADLALLNFRVGVKSRAICLNSHLGLNTALSNDISYEKALAMSISNFDYPGNVLVVFSASGNSENILGAVSAALRNKQKVFAFLGFDGGQILKESNVCSLFFRDTSRNYGIIENSHLTLSHFLIDELCKHYSKGQGNN